MADAKITGLTELTTIDDQDPLAVADDPAGSPITKKITKANFVLDTDLNLKAATELTIAAGVITATQSSHKLQPASGVADDLDTINGMSEGDILFVYVSDEGTDTITIKHGTGNISCIGDADVDLSEGAAIFYSDGTTAYLIGGGGGGVTNPLDANLDLSTYVILDQSKFVCNGRLTLETGVPVSTSDQTDKVALYFTPYKGNEVSLYDGANWIRHEFTERSLDISAFTASKPYDIFIYNNAGTLTLSGTVWTNDTTRATALVYQDGVYCKTGALTYRYLGTIYMDAASKCQDTTILRYVWNYYNRARRRFFKSEATASWAYTTATWRSANNSTANRVAAVVGVAEDYINVLVRVSTAQTHAGYRACGIGFDVTNTNSGQTSYFANQIGSGSLSTEYNAIPPAGYHFYQWTELAEAVGTCTWYSNVITTAAGLTGSVLG